MRRSLHLIAAATCCLLLSACASAEEPPPPQPEPEPVEVYDPAAGPGEGPGEGPGAPPAQPEPQPPTPSDKASIAVRKDDSPTKRVLFFNDFGRPHTTKVVAQLKLNRDFDAGAFSVDDANTRRITVECTYRGQNLRKSVSAACDTVGVPHHFREAELPKHLEVYRTKK